LRQLEAGAPAAIASDLTTARALTQAARDGALANVAINIESLPAAHPDRQRLLAALNQATRTPLFT
jgi:formiminotetrahydrofolate cyclodeaminase